MMDSYFDKLSAAYEYFLSVDLKSQLFKDKNSPVEEHSITKYSKNWAFGLYYV